MNTYMNNWVTAFTDPSNSVDPYYPEFWAQESLMILENNLVPANLIHRDFENQIQAEGDVVNTRLPASFTAKNKAADDSVTLQAASATNVPVNLNQHPHVSFVIRDEQLSKSIGDLRNEFLYPAVLALAERIDHMILSQVYGHIRYTAGKLGTAPTMSDVLELRRVMNENKVPQTGRQLVISPNAEKALLGVEGFYSAEKRADGGQALNNAFLGRIFGFDTYMCQQVMNPTGTVETIATAVNESAGVAKGGTSFDVDSATGITAGMWITVAGDMTPQLVTNVSTNTLTIAPGLRNAVDDDAVVTAYASTTVDASGQTDTEFAANFSKEFVTDAWEAAPVYDQMMTTGTTLATLKKYAISRQEAPTTTTMWLDRGLEATIADAASIFGGPVGGEYNFAFNRNAVALVMRPLAVVPRDMARSAVVNYNGLSLRVTMSYDGERQGYLITVDCLCGIKVLNEKLGAILLS